MKTKEELNELKKEAEAVNEKLQELTEEEIAQVSGGVTVPRVFDTIRVFDPNGLPKLSLDH